MNENRYRTTMVVACIGLACVASVAYDTLLIKPTDRPRAAVAAMVIVSLAAAFLLQRYPVRTIQPALLAAWPLHLFTLGFFTVCLVFQGGARLQQVIAYTLLAYATYLVLPLLLVLDQKVFIRFVKFLALFSGLLAIPSLVGALGYDSFFGIPLRNKVSYADLSGIIASGGVFEHPEGHALQMAAGMLCCLYAIRRSVGIAYIGCFFLTFAGLVVSQGRAAILGIMVAITFRLLPEVFRRSQPIFFGSLIVLLVFPFLILPRLAALPGLAGYLRLERGLSGRDAAWQYGLELIEEKPWTGHGFLASSELTELRRKWLRSIGFSGAGSTFHNTFISKAVELGVPVTLLYALLYIVPLSRICSQSDRPLEQQLILGMILLTLTASIFRDYNIGGVRSTALTGAVFLGTANLWSLIALWPSDTPTVAAELGEERPPTGVGERCRSRQPSHHLLPAEQASK